MHSNLFIGLGVHFSDEDRGRVVIPADPGSESGAGAGIQV